MGSCIMDFGCFSTFLLWHNFDVTKVAPTDENEPFQQYNLPTFDVFSSFHRLCKRIQLNINPSQTVILHALDYVKRLRMKAAQPKCHDQNLNLGKSKVLPPGTESTVFLTALMLATKFADDDRFTTRAWCQASGFSLGDINKMERECLIALDYRLFVSAHDLYQWSTSLKQFMEVHHPDEVGSVVVIPDRIMISTCTTTTKKEDIVTSKRRPVIGTPDSTSASHYTSISIPPSIKMSQPQRPAGLSSPLLGRIDNYQRSKPIEIKRLYSQTKWWVCGDTARSI
ncbi:hypothetical protein SeMB42_g06485 [Synchytrium endobioticum]|uniref:Cyclin N-terminal domain-containing protein n=1 Tax=Synchytrium endobioticum TaxID=286115 RepID=A0A507CLM7_9FUNG|nr:hypothetical protein SeMB42_g06485 [Synchytrium endobioticum]TPX51183.1 hypothetical protein SeLEV6574_g00443 [Synchytrium endobioticum]